ncbi:ABC transporter ATP-binding protein [Brucella sp. ZJ1_1]|uniref:Spermidine/putrescine import ATP-binding protein PotA n=4 Tax=Brucella/Ochrobactrum group TaxID=2826938 RepID=C4WLT3_9HYPH|nr:MULTISPECIES: ABC transporter ATP-binding protein [Brucella/Ochrobactrum group]ERI13277.1 spermidine/putrescine ABC transporter ATPase [Ochrobactrum sp. EGD-AQ16]BBA73100.1 spermidine/putrescine ABC transporter ATP-binding protein [Ochrobactrum sp. PW1]EEQ93633.1 polyamine ABC transporter, ATP-binding protein [Brucella intermedia LMG 3301]ELT49475.1 spermidine/putrescine ABC transporter ATP-binding protein [Brucella intermedia M86]KAB2694218.1 ABC transporter ATP-binding protein [Brucella i
MTDCRIRFENISKSYGDFKVIDGLNLDIGKGEFVSLLGPSGSGKTTLLMMLAGFESPSSGTIYVDGKPINAVPSYKRNMGVVFQNYALFPHMTVGENVAFPLQMRGVGKGEIGKLVDKVLDMVQLSPMRERKPSQLSGGQQQRVALARALVFEPGVVLMDEPLGALDKQLREQMQLDIRALHSRLGLTIVFVTHDQGEALTMSDRIAVFNKGKIEQIGTPRAIYDEPQTRFVAEFIGETNLAEGIIERMENARAFIRLKDGGTLTAASKETLAAGQKVLLSIRPERIELGSEDNSDNLLRTRVVDSVYQGDHLRIQLDGSAHDFIVRLDRKSREWTPGTDVVAKFSAADCWTIAA